MPLGGRSIGAAAALLALLWAAPLLGAQDGLRVMLEPSLEPPVAGSSWALTILAGYPSPGAVSAQEPPFPDGIFLEQVAQGPRAVSLASWLAGAPQAPAAERWTAIEYRFALSRPGTFRIGPFAVSAPLGAALTEPFYLEVRDPSLAEGARRRAAAWEGAPQGLRAGESASFLLRVGEAGGAAQGPGAAQALPRAALFMPPVPPGHMLERLPALAGDEAQGIALRLRLIPLEPGAFALEPSSFSYGGEAFDVPALLIPVGPWAGAAAGPAAQGPAPPGGAGFGGTAQAAAGSPALFPPKGAAEAASPRLFRRHGAEFGEAHRSALGLWESGRRAEALAELRRGERDHPAGELFAAIRREAEAALGISGAPDERRRGPLSALPPFREMRGARGGRSAVLRETPVRRVPDPAGEEIARLAEGRTATVGRESAAQGGRQRWALITASDGTAGWIPAEKIVLY